MQRAHSRLYGRDSTYRYHLIRGLLHASDARTSDAPLRSSLQFCAFAHDSQAWTATNKLTRIAWHVLHSSRTFDMQGEQSCAPAWLILATVLDRALRAAPRATSSPCRRNGCPDRTKELDGKQMPDVCVADVFPPRSARGTKQGMEHPSCNARPDHTCRSRPV